MKATEVQQIPEVKLAEGIYFTDYRQTHGYQSNNCMNSALNQQYLTLKTQLIPFHNIRAQNKTYSPPLNNLEILLADFKEFDNQIKYLRYSIEGLFINIYSNHNKLITRLEIEKEENWIQDSDFSGAVVENLGVIVKVLNYQKLCLAAIAKIDPNNTLIKELSQESIEEKIKNCEKEQISLKLVIKSNEKKPEINDIQPEGLLL